MHNISLNISQEIGEISRRSFFQKLGANVRKWLGNRIVDSTSSKLDKLILTLTGYHEKAIYFDAEHARSEAVAIKNHLGLLKKLCRKYEDLGPEDFLEASHKAFFEKYIEIGQLIDKIEHRLKLLSHIDIGLDKIEALPAELRQDVLSLISTRFQAFMELHPEEKSEMEEELDGWLESELATLED